MQRLFCFGFGVLLATSLWAQDTSDKTQAKLESWTARIVQLASDPVLVKAVMEQNASLPEDFAAMDQGKWSVLSEKEPFVYRLTKNPAALVLKEHKTKAFTEAFLNDAKGLKVAFLGKTSNWSHKGAPKHDEPMAGNSWRGKFEIDRSSGRKQVQLAVPVLKEGKPIGSLVVGISLEEFTGGQ